MNWKNSTLLDKRVKTIKKILYYRDIGLLWKVFFTSLNLSLISYRGNDKLLIRFAHPKDTYTTKKPDQDKILRYVNLCVFFRRILGIQDTCLTYSFFLCHMLRKCGLNSKVNFGIRKLDGEIKGHCWVTTNGIEPPIIYEPILSIP